MLKGFRDFILRGNVLDLAVAVVIGGAFGAIVTSLVDHIITPIIGAVGGQPDFSALAITVNNSRIMIGEFINSLLSFLIIASIIYFFVITPMNKLMERAKRGEKIDPTDKTCPECLSLIPVKAKRCKFCTAVLKK